MQCKCRVKGGIGLDVLSFTRLAETLRSDVARAREALRSMLTKKIGFTPVQLATGERTYRLAIEVAVGSIIADPAHACSKVRPDGI